MEKRCEKPIRVLLADGDSILMRGIGDRLRNELRIEALSAIEDGTPLPSLVSSLLPDILLCDVDSNGKCDFSIISEIHRVTEGRTKVFALSDHDDMSEVSACFSQGGWGYELKNCHEDEIALAIRRMARGYRFICSSMSGNFIYQIFQNSTPLNPCHLSILTPKEKEAISVYKKDGYIKSVAQKMDISVKTAETHIKNIMRKLDIHSQDELRRKLSYAVF